MPVWNALYQVRDFAANVEDVRATDASGKPVPVVNTKTSEWQMNAAGPCVVADYDIHLDTPGPFGSQLNSAARLLQLGDGADVFACASVTKA